MLFQYFDYRKEISSRNLKWPTTIGDGLVPDAAVFQQFQLRGEGR